jgi:FAD:protein FMN transferase
MRKILFLILLLATLTACNKQQKVSFSGSAQGTYYAVTYFDAEGRNMQMEVDSILDAFDQVASLWVENSILSKVNRGEEVELNVDFVEVFKQSVDVSERTDGEFDFTVGPLINVWGFSFKTGVDVDRHMADSILQFVGYRKVRLEDGQIKKEDPRIQFDFNAIAQGYSVDLLADFFRSKGIDRFLIDVGGEVYANRTKPGQDHWKVGIEHPSDDPNAQRELEVVVILKNKALATSGNYRKFYIKDGVKYAHTVSPKSGFPVQHSLLSATVMANDCSIADAYATAFMVMGLENAKKFLKGSDLDLEALFIYSDEDGIYQNWYSSGLKDQIIW